MEGGDCFPLSEPQTLSLGSDPEAEQRLYFNGQPHVTVIFPFILNCFHTAAAVGSERLGGSSFPVADDRSGLHSAWRRQMV